MFGADYIACICCYPNRYRYGLVRQIFYHLNYIVWNTQSIYFSTKIDELFVYLHFCAISENASMLNEIQDIAFVPLLTDFGGLLCLVLGLGNCGHKTRKFLREHISQFVLERIVIRKKSTVFRFLDNHLILTDAEYLMIRLGVEAQLFRLTFSLCVW